jgi:hypothetical protein
VHIHREGTRLLSTKAPSPVDLGREAFAESFFLVKLLSRGKTPSARGTSLAAKVSFLVVRDMEWDRKN